MADKRRWSVMVDGTSYLVTATRTLLDTWKVHVDDVLAFDPKTGPKTPAAATFTIGNRLAALHVKPDLAHRTGVESYLDVADATVTLAGDPTPLAPVPGLGFPSTRHGLASDLRTRFLGAFVLVAGTAMVGFQVFRWMDGLSWWPGLALLGLFGGLGGAGMLFRGRNLSPAHRTRKS